MTTAEMLADLSDRIDRAVAELVVLRREVDDRPDRSRLSGKIDGLLVVKDWLRSYSTDQEATS